MIELVAQLHVTCLMYRAEAHQPRLVEALADVDLTAIPVIVCMMHSIVAVSDTNRVHYGNLLSCCELTPPFG